MQKIYYDLWEPFFGGIYENDGPLSKNPEMEKRIEDRKDQRVDVTAHFSGPFLRYDYGEKEVKLFFSGRRFFVFPNVGGTMELIFADGRVEQISGNRINVPEPIPCSAKAWNDWKRYLMETITDILIFENGIVVLDHHCWDGVDSYTMSAFNDGNLIARFSGYFPIEEERSFFERMLNSDDAQPFVDEIAEKDEKAMAKRWFQG